mgnify:CR=1 FL=1
MFCGHAIANGRDFRQTRRSINNGLIYHDVDGGDAVTPVAVGCSRPHPLPE